MHLSIYKIQWPTRVSNANGLWLQYKHMRKYTILMKTFSKTRVGTMIKIAPWLDPRIYILKSYRSKDEYTPWSQSNYKWGWSYSQIAMHAYAPCGLNVSKPWVSHSQPWFSHSHCAHIITTGSHMLTIVDTWGCIQHNFKSCLAIVTIGFYSVSLKRMHWHLVPQKIKQSYTKNYDALVHNINQARQSFSQQGFVPNHSMTACSIATVDVYIHHQCHQSIFPLNMFYASLIITY